MQFIHSVNFLVPVECPREEDSTHAMELWPFWMPVCAANYLLLKLPSAASIQRLSHNVALLKKICVLDSIIVQYILGAVRDAG